MLRLYINIYYKLYQYKYIHVNTFSKYILYVCVFIYTKYTQYTHIYYVNKNFLLDAIDHD